MKRCRFPLFLIGEIHNCRKESGLSKRGVNVAAKKAEKNSAIQKKFYISQIETTKRIIKTFSETTEFSPAMLINSLLSLVILPYERAKESGGGRIFPGKYPDLIRKIGISPQIFTPIQSCSNGDVVYNRKTIYTFDVESENEYFTSDASGFYSIVNGKKKLERLLDTSLTVYEAPKDVVLYANEAFSHCNALRKIVLADGTETLGYRKRLPKEGKRPLEKGSR